MITAIIAYFYLSVLCMVLFLIGYFPINQIDLKIQDPPTHINDHKFNIEKIYKPEIDRLILIIIDALRDDFITPENMPYLFNEHDCKLLVKVESPTVTLPRIKALTTGGVPQFIDIILNLGATTKCDDSFLHRAQVAQKKMIFYGDNTWLKIYPDLFIRSDGTSSFYVNDFTEVDYNVTRHIAREMKNDDWDIMVLHYLGLDHIGHVRGPFSNLIAPKLNEMDDVVSLIHKESLKINKRTLILITGDHGMKDSGGHGGMSYAETHVPLISFGIPCKSQKLIAQTDIPTTLSALFGIQMPASAIGKIIPEFFTNLPLERFLYILRYNLLILQKTSNICKENFINATKTHYEFMRGLNLGDNIAQMYENCLELISKEIIKNSVQQNLELLIFALLTIINSLITILIYYFSIYKLNLNYNKISFINVLIFILMPNNLCIYLIILIIAINIFKLIKILLLHKNKLSSNLYIFAPIIHHILLISSSFIEEEHQIVFYLLSTSVLIMSYKLYTNKSIMNGLNLLIILIFMRISRRLNSVGDQWASMPDFADWFMLEQNFIYLQIFFACSLMLIFICLLIFLRKPRLQLPLFAIIIFLIFIYKIHYSNYVSLAQIIWLLIAFTTITQIVYNNKSIDNVIVTWILIITLLLRPYNTILVPIAIFGSQISIKSIENIKILTLIQIWYGYALFFCQGHSHSIASIDLAPGYIGLSHYIPPIVFILTLIHTYAFPILTSLLLLKKHTFEANQIWIINIICRLMNLIIICLINFILRHHLFVWSVFAPKLLIEAAHTLLLSILISIFYCFVCIYKLFK